MVATPAADSKVKRTCARRLFDEMPQEQVKVSGRHNRRKVSMVGIDTLPDEVLARVLSFLPVREAVQTCVLARRWRHLWKSMPALRIVFEDGPLTPEDVDDMNRFVNMFMFLRDRGAPLEFFEFKIDDLIRVRMNRISACGSNKLCCLKLVASMWNYLLCAEVYHLMTCISSPSI
ncbi:unnamed protein product [Urochloa decumbens]|uniref:F-box domain-containing protein n=1 Tax=Urochloa decumbens TaxID=240449 RepID=A0ABC9B5Z0_9POAL